MFAPHAMQMQQPRTPYQVLNVSSDAEPEVIDAAYKALMKKYHPDKFAGEPPLSESKAAEINDAFRILRDPTRRARHDADEKSKRAVMAGVDRPFDASRGAAPFAPKPEPWPAPAAGNRPPPPQQPQRYTRALVLVPQRRRGQRAVGWVAVIAALLLIAITVAHTQGAGRIAGFSFANSFKAAAYGGSADPVRTRVIAPVSRERIEEALAEFERVRAIYGSVGVLAYSDACFDAQSRSRELSDLDFCVAFDHAASALDAALGETSELPGVGRFSGEQLDGHHLAAAKLLPEDYGRIEQRLAAIKTMTYGAIASAQPTAVNAPPPTAPPSVTVRGDPKRYVSVRRQPAQSGAPPADAEFLEREGGIY